MALLEIKNLKTYFNTKRGISPGRRLKSHAETDDAPPENA